MKLTTILSTPGVHVWAFTRETNIKTIHQAQSRLQSYLHQKESSKYAKVKVKTTGAVLTSVKDYTSEPVLIVEVE